MLLDNFAYSNYQSGRDFEYYGGYFDEFPVELEAPCRARWNLVVDWRNLRHDVTATFQVDRNPYPRHPRLGNR